VLPRHLDLEDVDPNPVTQFSRWFVEAQEAGQPEPEAMALATLGGTSAGTSAGALAGTSAGALAGTSVGALAGGTPSIRFVLLKGVDERGFAFYTNYNSRKGRELDANPVAALVFRWWTLERQVRVEGRVLMVDTEESDAYFATRPRGAQLGAWASAQSEVLANREQLEASLEEVTARFDGREVPRPSSWGGYRVAPNEVEFWQGRPDRLHDRLRYKREATGWRIERLSP
jgi:pyridoxamine 5'-phosphate oxidase